LESKRRAGAKERELWRWQGFEIGEESIYQQEKRISCTHPKRHASQSRVNTGSIYSAVQIVPGAFITGGFSFVGRLVLLWLLRVGGWMVEAGRGLF